MQHFIFPAILLVLISCQQNTKVPVPDDDWKIFDTAATQSLNKNLRDNLEGVYAIENTEDFGPLAAFKWSYTVIGKDTTHHLSIFCEKDISYFVCEGKSLNDKILLNGYWRKMDEDETGKFRCMISKKNPGDKKTFVLEGKFGKDDSVPNREIKFKWLRPLNDKSPLEIVAHRGGGTITDFIPSSENSIELLMQTVDFGATGVEIDVQQTKDSVLVLFHDAHINDRLTKQLGNYLPVSKYTYSELIQKFQLKKGEQIPRLDDALDSIIHRTPLQFVWLDVKNKELLPKLCEYQQKYMKLAAGIGRKIEILVGIHDDEISESFQSLPGFRNIPSICELEPEDAIIINAKIWAPVWVKNFPAHKIESVHLQGRRAIVWTVDKPEQIQQLISEGKFDGIVSNYPSCVAFYYYTRQ